MPQFCGLDQISPMTAYDRGVSTFLAVVVLGALGWILFIVAHATWATYWEDERYATSALQSDGRISGYTYWDGGTGKNASRRAGYYANVTFQTPEGPFTVRTQRRYDTPEDQKAMLGWRVDVLYFPGEKERARIAQWSGPSWPSALPALLLILFGCLGVIRLIYGWWRPRR